MKAALRPSAYIAPNEWEVEQPTNLNPLDVEECIIGLETTDHAHGRTHAIAFTAWKDSDLHTEARPVTFEKFQDVKGALQALWSNGRAKTYDFGKHYQVRLVDVVDALTR